MTTDRTGPSVRRVTQTSPAPGPADPLAPERSAPGARWTAEEVAQQPALWREVARAAATAPRVPADLLAREDLRVVLTGAGTSAFAGGLLAPALARALGRRVEAVATTDVVPSPADAFADDVPTLLVSFARSGDSPESLAATRLADELLTECHHLVVTCNPDGALARAHAHAPRSTVLLMPPAADDRAFAMTSSLTCMTVATRLALDPAVPADAVERVAAAAEQVLATAPARTRALAAQAPPRVVYLGSGALTALARESALKLLELTAGRVVAYADSSLGFRHGPKAVLDPTTLVVVLVSGDPHARRYDLDLVAELRAGLPAGHVVVVTGDAADGDAGGADGDDGATWRVPGLEGLDDAWRALPFVVHAQLLALQTSVHLGLTPDNPFPTGEVNRVVQGVTVHPYDAGPAAARTDPSTSAPS